MSEILELKAELRTCVGKGASRRLRRNAGLVPAIIYGEKTDPTLITLQHNKVTRALQDKNYYSSVVTVNVGKISEKVILKALQRHPYKKEILHMDFLRINADEKLQMNIPIHFMGEEIAPGVKTENGVITHYFNEIEVRCLP